MQESIFIRGGNGPIATRRPLRNGGARGNATIIYEGTVSVERKPGPPGYLSLGTVAVFGDRSAGTAQGRGAALATALPG